MSSTAGSSTEDGRKLNGRTELGVEYVKNGDLLKNWNILLTVSNPLVKDNIGVQEKDGSSESSGASDDNTGNSILDVTEAFTEDLDPIAIGNCMIIKAPIITEKVGQYRKGKKSMREQSARQDKGNEELGK